MEDNVKIKHCKKCLMPNTRLGSTVFDDDGVCQACLNYEKRERINWKERKKELENLCDKYRREDGYYDCIVPVSGGKDSTFLVYMMKVKMGMNPLLVTIGCPFTQTKAGAKNLMNLKDTFGCDHIQFDLSIDLFRKVTRIAFEKFGEPLRFLESAIFTMPTKIAIKLGIPLMVYGESDYEYGSAEQKDCSAMRHILKLFKNEDINFWLQEGISKKELNAITLPPEEDLKRIEPIFMGYFVPWSSTRNFEIAKRYGFIDLAHEWKREGYIEDFEQIDYIGYIVHHWLKYPKFGFQRISDIASRYVREGIIDLPTAKKSIIEGDHKLDQRAMEDFVHCLGYTVKEFWDIVERFWNRDLFEKVDDAWRKKFNYEE